MTKYRFERQEAFFGRHGQDILKDLTISIVGVGGIGSHVAQQLAFLGIGNIIIIDEDRLELSNLNRLIGATSIEKEGTPKVDICERMIKSINEGTLVAKLSQSVLSYEAIDKLIRSQYIFGCIDNDGARLFLNEFSQAYCKPYIDIATEILRDGSEYGGRVVSMLDDVPGCLYCFGEISQNEAQIFLSNPDARKDRDDIYGVAKSGLENSGPSVVTLNGLLASIATTEFLVHVTGKRKANKFLTYRGSRGLVVKNADAPETDCYYCNFVRGKGESANLHRYIPSVIP